MHLVLAVPITNTRGPQYVEAALAAIHAANPKRLPVTLIMGMCGPHHGLQCEFPPKLRTVIEGQLAAAYPDCQFKQLDESDAPVHKDHATWTTTLRLNPDLLFLKTAKTFEDTLNRELADPLATLLTLLHAEQGKSLSTQIRIDIRPAAHKAIRRAERVAWILQSKTFERFPGFSQWYATRKRSGKLWNRTIAAIAGFIATGAIRPRHPVADQVESPFVSHQKLKDHLFEVTIQVNVSGPMQAEDAARQRLTEVAGGFAHFLPSHLAEWELSPVRKVANRKHPIRVRPFLLSISEVALLWHPPTESVRTEALATVTHRELEPPVDLPTQKDDSTVAVLGESVFRNRSKRFGLLLDDRRRHLALLGKTGMGKSTLLLQMIASDIAAGRGVALIDPHGDLFDAVVKTISKHRTNDVVLFDAGDLTHPISFNMLACDDPSTRPLVASGILSAFRKLYAESWGPRLEHILRNCLLTLLEVPGSTLLNLQRLLIDSRYRSMILRSVHDPVIRQFWEQEFAGMPTKLRAEAIAPIQNKVGHFVTNPILRNIIGQSTSRLNLRNIMDDGKILLCNLSKGRIGDDASMLLGSFLVTAIQIAAMSRADTSEEERRDFFLTVDEFGCFATDSFASILSEARKYHLCLTIANQYLAQIPEPTLASVFGNIGNLLVFQIGAQDSEVLSEQLGSEITPQDLLTVPRYHAYARILIDGHPSRPFSMRTLPPSRVPFDPLRAEIIRRVSRRRFTRSLHDVEQHIAREMGV